MVTAPRRSHRPTLSRRHRSLSRPVQSDSDQSQVHWLPQTVPTSSPLQWGHSPSANQTPPSSHTAKSNILIFIYLHLQPGEGARSTYWLTPGPWSNVMETNTEDNVGGGGEEIPMRCKKCRHILLQHPQGMTSFNPSSPLIPPSNVFLEPRHHQSLWRIVTVNPGGGGGETLTHHQPVHPRCGTFRKWACPLGWRIHWTEETGSRAKYSVHSVRVALVPTASSLGSSVLVDLG